jgi:hypothetical protein
LIVRLFVVALTLAVSWVSSSAWAQTSPESRERLVSSQSDLIDAEFNQERGQIVWVDVDGQMWVADVNRRTGALEPADGKGQLVDPDALTLSEVLGKMFNGPEWLPAADGVHIVYTKFLPNRPRTLANARLALAQQSPDGSWRTEFLSPASPRNAPYASTDAGDPSPRITYVDPAFNHYWREVADAATEETIPGTVVGPRSVRFIGGHRAVVFAAPADGVSQIFRYDLDSKVLEQLTFDDGDKDLDTVPWMWEAPEFNNSLVLMTVANRNEMRFYRQLPVIGGGLQWTFFARRKFEDNSKVLSPEPLVYAGQSYIFSSLVAPPQDIASQIWLVNLSKSEPFMRRLDKNSPVKGRMDPEVFVTDRGPYIYYNRFDSTRVPGQPFCPTCSEGLYRAHTLLPAPN